MVGKEPVGNRNAVGDVPVVTQGKGFLQGTGPKRSGVGVAGLKRDGLVARNPAGVVVGRKLLGSR